MRKCSRSGRLRLGGIVWLWGCGQEYGSQEICREKTCRRAAGCAVLDIKRNWNGHETEFCSVASRLKDTDEKTGTSDEEVVMVQDWLRSNGVRTLLPGACTRN